MKFFACKAVTMLEHGIWANVDFCPWAMVVPIWLKNMLFLVSFIVRVVLFTLSLFKTFLITLIY